MPYLAEHIRATVDAFARTPRNEQFTRVFRVLAEGWAGRRVVEIEYDAGAYEPGKGTERRRVQPWAIEPSALTHALYLIGWDEGRQARRTFKVERILSASLTPHTFTADSAATIALDMLRAWDVIADEDPIEVVIRFSASVAKRAAGKAKAGLDKLKRTLGFTGVDDVFNVPQRDLATNRLIAGRDYFLDFGTLIINDRNWVTLDKWQRSMELFMRYVAPAFIPREQQARRRRMVDGVADSRRRRPCSGVSQFPRRTPIRRTPFTRRMPAASSGLKSLASAASYATRRTASRSCWPTSTPRWPACSHPRSSSWAPR